MNPTSTDYRTAGGVRPDATLAAPVTDRGPANAWTLARAVLTVVFCASGLVALVEVWQVDTEIPPTVVAAVLMAALLAIQLFHFSRPGTDLRSPQGYVLLAVLALLAYIPLVHYGWTWLSLPPFLAGCVLLVLPRVTAWASFTAIMGSLVVIRYLLAESTLTVLYDLFDAYVFGLAVYLLTKLAIVVAELHTARGDLADLAVAEQRLKFARDLHDLLGLNLSTITVKGERILRALNTFPQQARTELGEVLDIAHRALADARSVASGYRELSVGQETRSAESVLTASGVHVRMESDPIELPAHIGNVLGAALREGVTNVLRHSDAQDCEISIHRVADTVVLDIVNDGVEAQPAISAPDTESVPSGLRNLAARVTALHGELRTPTRRDGKFQLRIQVPLNAPPTDEQPRVRTTRWAVRDPSPLNAGTSQLLVNTVFVCIYIATAMHVLMLSSDPATLAWSLGYLTALTAVQLAFFCRVPRRVRPLTPYVLLLVQAILVYAPMVQLREQWVSVPGWVAGDALLWLSPVAGWLVFAADVGVVIWAHAVLTGQALDITFQAAAAIITGLIAFGLISLTRLITELHATRKQLANKAVAEERLRFARDLHDLLGLSLSAITLKCELVKRLLTTYPGRAADELRDILSLVRQALAEVRTVAGGYRELSLDKESESAEAVLAAAEVAVHIDLDYDGLPVDVRTVLAVVLREGVTNVLRHSNATRCDIVLRQCDESVSLAIINDGAAEHRGRLAGAPSSGIRNLSERVDSLGGELAHGPEEDGRYQLLATLPI